MPPDFAKLSHRCIDVEGIRSHDWTRDVLTLVAGAACCTLDPAHGGSITGWSIGSQPMLRTTDAAARASGDPLRLSSFPLVPFSNRIGFARFDWRGSTIALTPNFAPEPHAIHGVGWTSAWTIDACSDTAATLVLRHAWGPDWPWPFEARQTITLAEHGLDLALSVRNLADCAVPLGFGHHPYFDAEGASLRFSAATVWLTGDDGLPARPVVPSGDMDFSGGVAIAGRCLDHGYAGIGRHAHIDWRHRPLALDIHLSANLAAAVVYIPCGADSFCFEPVPHLINALNLPGQAPAMPVVAAGERFAAAIHFAAVPSGLSAAKPPIRS